jgi:hypothetical protein
MSAQGAIISLHNALHGVTLIKDNLEADRCGLLCLFIKTALTSGCHVR